MQQHSNEPSLIANLTETIENCYQKAEYFFNQSFTRPKVELNLRGYSAGTATPSLNLLRFNKTLLLQNQQHFLKHTVPHEVAHLVAYQLFGLNIRPHGKEWQHIMRMVYAIPAERCHQYAVKKKPTTYYHYYCDCDIQHRLTIRRHNAIKKGRQYICKSCQAILQYNNKIEQQ